MLDRSLPDFTSLAGQFLIAMPNIEDLRFHKTVVYITHHTEKTGAIGIVINRPTDITTCHDILDQMNIKHDKELTLPPLLLGGPVNETRGFILHSNDQWVETTQNITESTAVTSTKDLLENIIAGHRPRHFLIAVGCAIWETGQLEEEIMGNVWATVPANTEVLFNTPIKDKWSAAFALLGIDPTCLSSNPGKA